MLANRCSGKVRPLAVTVAASIERDSTRTSALKFAPGTRAANARSIAAQSAADPPDSAASRPPPATRQCDDCSTDEPMAGAFPQKNTPATSANDVESFRDMPSPLNSVVPVHAAQQKCK